MSFIDALRPTEIKRLPWMRRIHVHSPKLGRTLVLFSEESINAWALIESCPLITAFCEHPGYVDVGGHRVLAEFWIQGEERQAFLKLDAGIELVPERPEQVRTFTEVVVESVVPGWFEPYRHWIANWLQINPYLVSNARFVTSEMLNRVTGVFATARPLYDAEHALREMDRQLARTAIFMLLHQGQLRSDDLMLSPLASTTVFCRSDA